MKQAITSDISSATDVDAAPLVPVLRMTGDESAANPDLSTPAAHAYLLSFFALDRKAFDADITKFVRRNEYLIRRPASDALSSALALSMAEFSSLYLRDTAPISDGAQNLDLATTPAALAGMYEKLLTSEIPEGAWQYTSTSPLLEDKVNGLCQRIFAQPHPLEAGTPAMKLWGYHFLRWMLFAGKPGPALVPSMLLLGRDEVLKRVRDAGEAAKSWRPVEERGV